MLKERLHLSRYKAACIQQFLLQLKKVFAIFINQIYGLETSKSRLRRIYQSVIKAESGADKAKLLIDCTNKNFSWVTVSLQYFNIFLSIISTVSGGDSEIPGITNLDTKLKFLILYVWVIKLYLGISTSFHIWIQTKYK